MSDIVIFDVLNRAIWVATEIGAPVLLLGGGVGLLMALVQAATARPSKQPRDPLRDVADKLQALHSKLAGLRKERRKLEEEESKLEAEATELTDRLRKHIPAANLQSARRKHIPALLSWRSPPLAPAM